MKQLIIVFILCLLLLQFVSPVYAGVSCQSMYGAAAGCQAQNDLKITLAIENPKTLKFENIIDCSAARFHKGDPIYFRLYVENNTAQDMPNATTTLTLPIDVSFVKGDGKFDANTNKLTNQTTLPANKGSNIFVTGKINPKNNFNLIVENTQASASYSNLTAGESAQLCIESQVLPAQTKGGFPVVSPLPVNKTPSTGPEDMAMIFIALSGFGSILMKKFATRA